MKPAIRCPRCSSDIGIRVERGDDYCPRCGFEFSRCGHCGADARRSVQDEGQICEACQRCLKPDAPPLPDDPFWNSPPGQFIHILILVGIVGTGVLLSFGVVYAIQQMLK